MTHALAFSPGAAEVAFRIVTSTWFVFELGMNIRQRLRRRGGGGLDSSEYVVVLTLGVGIVAAELLAVKTSLPWPGGRVWPLATGLTMIAAGIAVRAWAILTLGRFFQYRITIQEGHRVITGGPYRFVRHPSYTGIALALTGLALACGNILSLAAVAVIGGTGLGVRIWAEERQLTAALGDEYRRFAASRKRLVPGVW